MWVEIKETNHQPHMVEMGLIGMYEHPSYVQEFFDGWPLKNDGHQIPNSDGKKEMDRKGREVPSNNCQGVNSNVNSRKDAPHPDLPPACPTLLSSTHSI